MTTEDPTAAAAAPAPAPADLDAPAAQGRAARRRRTGDDLIRCIDQWPAHPGWKRWLFRVWDKRARSYVSEAFDDREKEKGWAWAEHQRSLLEQGRTGAGPVLFEAVGLAYVADLKRIGRTQAHRDEVERLYKAVVAAGAVNMRDEGFAQKVADWLGDAACFPKHEVDGPAKPQGHRPVLANLRARLARAEQLVTTCPSNQRKRYAGRVEHWRARVARAESRAEVREPAAVTKNRWLVILKSIAKSAKRYGMLDNPLTVIKRFKQDKVVKPALRVEELRAMVADERAGDAYYREACALVYGGFRADEAAHIRKDWIDREARTITLRVIRDAKGKVTWAPKGNKERIVPILAEFGELIDGWLAADVAAGGSRSTGWMIGDDRLRALKDKGHWKTFREYLGRCGIDAAARDLSPHKVRHTWTAIRLCTGVSPNRLRRELGHETLETTDIYAEAEAMYDQVVKDWPRGEMCLRRPPTAAAQSGPGFLLDCDRDPREVLDLFVARGGKLDQLAAAADVPAAVLRTWMIDGIPDAVRQYLAVMAASARLAAEASAPKALTVIPILGAPLTAAGESR